MVHFIQLEAKQHNCERCGHHEVWDGFGRCLLLVIKYHHSLYKYIGNHVVLDKCAAIHEEPNVIITWWVPNRAIIKL